MKIGVGDIMSAHLGEIRKKEFSKLDDVQKRLFNHYGIRAEHWDVMRAVQGRIKGDGFYITAEQIRDVPDEVVTEALRLRDGDPERTYTESQIAAFKQEAETRLRVYYTDRIDHAVLEPGARENAILNQGLRRGSVEGEAIRFVMQFKSFPSTFLAKVWGRELYARGRADYAALLTMVATTTLMGYASMSAKDIAKGREPRNPFSAATMAAAMTQGGGMGILGDFAFGEFNRFGRSFAETAAGPTASMVGDVLKVWSAARNGQDFSATLLNGVLSNTPYANMFYLREPMNRLFLYQLQEYLNPGYLRRMEQRLKTENKQNYLIRPTS
jgi:hypothetical protein